MPSHTVVNCGWNEYWAMFYRVCLVAGGCGVCYAPRDEDGLVGAVVVASYHEIPRREFWLPPWQRQRRRRRRVWERLEAWSVRVTYTGQGDQIRRTRRTVVVRRVVIDLSEVPSVNAGRLVLWRVDSHAWDDQRISVPLRTDCHAVNVTARDAIVIIVI